MEKLRYISRGILIVCCLLLQGISCTEAVAAQKPQLNLELNQSIHINAGGHITKVAVGNPKIADVVILSSSTLLLNGKESGSTTLLIWTSNGMRQEYAVSVSPLDSVTARTIQAAIHLPLVQVQKAGDRILLQGMVKNQFERDTAKKIALLYAKTADDVIDMLEMDNPSQIELEAQILEITTEDTKKLGLKYSSPTSITQDSTSGFQTVTLDSTPGTFYGGEDFRGQHDTSSWILNHLSHIDATINLMIQTGKARILSRPHITTMSGEEASILIGGKIPVPIKKDGETTFEWRDYGINLKIKPVADSSENITANVHAEVSTLDYANEIKTSDAEMPAIASREANAVVNVPSGMTMMIGGLLNSEESKTITKVPLLGDLPIIGEFFKHTSKTRDKRELVILITPRLVNETTKIGMSSEMKNNYEDGKKEKQEQEQVDLTKEDRLDYQAEQKEIAQQREKDSSLLGKYLNRKVLPKAADAEN